MPKSISFRYATNKVATAFLFMAAILNILAFAIIFGYLIWKGAGALSWELLSESPRNAMTEGGILPCIVGTILLSLGSLAFSLPLGVASAVYLHEYAGQSRFSSLIRLGINNLAGVPSIVFGLFGFSFFVIFLGMGVSLLSGILTLGIITLPIIISSSEEALRQIDNSYRESSYALGATPWQTITKAILPMAAPGILTGAILGLSRAAGETAAIMFTASVFFKPDPPTSIMDPVMALPYHIYVLATSGTEIEKTIPLQFASALVLAVLILGMNMVAIIIRDNMAKKRV